MPDQLNRGEDRIEATARRILVAALLVLTLAAVAALALGGCIEPGAGPPQDMCQVQEDCPSGTVCGDDGICYGNPPALRLAAELRPLSHPELARTEIEDLDIGADGRVGNAGFAPSVVLDGVVKIADSGTAVGAQLTFSRPSRIDGAPDYVATTRAEGDRGFKVRLVPSRGGELYEVTILPDRPAAPGGGQPAPAELAPPLKTWITVSADTTITFALGDNQGEGMKRITGRVISAVGAPEAGYIVQAYGTYNQGAKLLASSIGTTDAEGDFSLLVPKSWDDLFDIVVAPAAGEARPMIVREAVEVLDPPGNLTPTPPLLDFVLPANHPTASHYKIPVEGAASAGGTDPVKGAHVSVRTVLESRLATREVVTYETAGDTGDSGHVDLLLIPGAADRNRTYDVTVFPRATAAHGAVWSQEMAVGPGGGATQVLPAILLPDRVRVTGTVVDAAGRPVEGLQVRARPSFLYMMQLSAGDRDRVLQLDVFPQVSTDPDGRFAVPLEPFLLSAVLPAARYDLELEPPLSSLAPRWSLDDLEPGLETPAVDAGTVALPPASHARGLVLGEDGAPVEGVEVRVYIQPDPAICQALGDRGPCDPPARLGALTLSDADGLFRLALPAPTTP